jgi:hypothetical protein
MIIAALVAFAVLLVAWILAPSRPVRIVDPPTTRAGEPA